MIIPKEYPSKEVLQSIATVYRRRGYDVSVEPSGRDLPAFLADATPDLIAHRGDEHLVIEVKHSPKGVDPAQLNAIAERIAKEPGWRFVVLAVPQAANVQHGTLQTVDEPSIKRQVEEADSLLRSGHVAAALMLVWAALEAILRLLVVRHHLSITRADAASLIRLLVSEGVIGDDAFRQLNDGLALRNALAHGARVIDKESADEGASVTRTLSKLSDALLRELAAA